MPSLPLVGYMPDAFSLLAFAQAASRTGVRVVAIGPPNHKRHRHDAPAALARWHCSGTDIRKPNDTQHSLPGTR